MKNEYVYQMEYNNEIILDIAESNKNAKYVTISNFVDYLSLIPLFLCLYICGVKRINESESEDWFMIPATALIYGGVRVIYFFTVLWGLFNKWASLRLPWIFASFINEVRRKRARQSERSDLLNEP